MDSDLLKDPFVGAGWCAAVSQTQVGSSVLLLNKIDRQASKLVPTPHACAVAVTRPTAFRAPEGGGGGAVPKYFQVFAKTCRYQPLHAAMQPSCYSLHTGGVLDHLLANKTPSAKYRQGRTLRMQMNRIDTSRLLLFSFCRLLVLARIYNPVHAAPSRLPRKEGIPQFLSNLGVHMQRPLLITASLV
jgi:hypothetical protein